MTPRHQRPALVIDVGDDRVAFMDGQWGGRIKRVNELKAVVGQRVSVTPHAPIIAAGLDSDDISPWVSAYAQACAAWGGRFECKEVPTELESFLIEWGEDYIHHSNNMEINN